MEIKIEKNIPVPKKDRDSKYPFASMHIGDSFAVDKSIRVCVSSACCYFKKHTTPKRKFVGRTIGKYYRIWRTA